MTARELLQRLLDATPIPPADYEDLAALLAASARVVTAREQILASAEATPIATEEERGMLRELEGRQFAWQVSLAIARERVASHRANAKKLSAYAPAP